jgi:pyruvate dehydrogenase E2 component (dihydrolipoamide acetyltransferase)
MAIEIKVPDIGADEVEITEILVKVGDKVEAEQSLITVEGDKASMEVPSPQAGIVKEIKVSVGDKTQTGALIMIFDSADGAADAAPAQAEEKKEAAPAAAPAGAAGSVQVTAPMPGKVVAVKASVGQAVKKGEVVLVLEAMKMENDIVAPEDGTIASINVANGDAVESGAVLATLN